MPAKRKSILYRLIEWLGPGAIRLIGYTLRIERINAEKADELYREGKPHLLCGWHGRLFVPVFWHRHRGIMAMVSQHADGEVISRIVKKFGYGTVRGSSTRGGKEAFYQLLAHLKNGGAGAMIPDGPTGPRYRLKAGSVKLAQQAGCPLLPTTFAARPCWRFNSWDHLVLPKPFARAVLLYGDPILLPLELTSDEIESWRQKIEKIMIDQVKAAEAHLGYILPEAMQEPSSDRKEREDFAD